MAKFKKTNFKKSVVSNTEKQNRDSKGFGYLLIDKGVETYKPKEGKNLINIIPYIVGIPNHPDSDGEGTAEKGSLWYRMPFKVHRDIGPDNISVICPTTFGKPCPVCEYMSKLRTQGAEWEIMKAFKPSDRALYVVQTLDDKKKKELMIWDMSFHLFQKALNEELLDNDEFANFPDLEEGFSLRIRMSEETLGKNKFMECTRIDFEERKPIDETILDEVPQLDVLLKVFTYKELDALMNHISPEDVEDEDEDEPVTKKPARKTKPAPEPEEDEDEEEEVEDEDEDDEPAPPVRKKKPAPAPDPEEDDDDDDDEDEPAPKKKPTTTPKKGKCPHGHAFGKDTDTEDECDDCDVFDDCFDAFNANKRK